MEERHLVYLVDENGARSEFAETDRNRLVGRIMKRERDELGYTRFVQGRTNSPPRERCRS